MQFSIIIPTYNRLPFLKIAAQSVLDQTYADWELWVVDDGSTDDTQTWIRNLDDQRIHYIYQENQGPAAARNAAIKQAQGDFICMLDSDDRFVPEKLERTAVYINNHPNINVFHTQEVWYRNGQELKQKKKHAKPDGQVYERALEICCISISTVAIKKEVFDHIGLMDESYPACEDYEFWLRATYQYEVRLIDEYLTLKDGGREDQLSASIWGLDRFRIKALRKMLDSSLLKRQDYAKTYNVFREKCEIFMKGLLKRDKQKDAQYYQELIKKYQI